MELKLGVMLDIEFMRVVLIVLYGIETWMLVSSATSQRVLIVLYGIETEFLVSCLIFWSRS